MENNRKSYKIKKIIIFLLSFVLLSCSNTNKKENINKSNSQSISHTTLSQKKENTNKEGEKDIDFYYKEILDLAQNIYNNYKVLQKKCEEFLNKFDNKTNYDVKIKCMNVSVICSASYYLDNNINEAEKYAQNSYNYLSNNAVIFLPEWDVVDIAKKEGIEKAKKMAQIKDFIRSCNNNGFSLFVEGNEAFIGKSLFEKAVGLYREALSKGIKDKSHRYTCYIRLSACLFKNNKKDEAEKVFFERWLLDPDIDIENEFGDIATKDFLKQLKDKFDSEY